MAERHQSCSADFGAEDSQLEQTQDIMNQRLDSRFDVEKPQGQAVREARERGGKGATDGRTAEGQGWRDPLSACLPRTLAYKRARTRMYKYTAYR